MLLSTAFMLTVFKQSIVQYQLQSMRQLTTIFILFFYFLFIAFILNCKLNLKEIRLMFKTVSGCDP